MRIPECLLAGSALLLVLPAAARADVMEVTYSIVPRIVILGDSGNPSTHATGRLSLRYAASSSVPASVVPRGLVRAGRTGAWKAELEVAETSPLGLDRARARRPCRMSVSVRTGWFSVMCMKLFTDMYTVLQGLQIFL